MFKTIWQIQSSPIMNLPRRLSFSVRSRVSREPSLWLLYQPYLWWGQMKRRATGGTLWEGLLLPDTELVIDGFQGSANSFATVAFRRSQTRQVKLMHHRHAATLIIRAVEQDIPVLLTVREPVGTVLSVASRWPHIAPTQILHSYIGFYSKLEPYASRCVVSTLELTTCHLDRVVRAINDRFGTDFDLVDVAQANTKFKPTRNHMRTEPLKQEKRKELATPENTQLIEKAKAVYQKFEAIAQQTVRY